MINWEDINYEDKKTTYLPMLAYRQSKLANILFSNELGIREAEHGINTYSLHPGVIATDLWRHLGDKPIIGTLLNNLITPFFKEITFSLTFSYKLTKIYHYIENYKLQNYKLFF